MVCLVVRPSNPSWGCHTLCVVFVRLFDCMYVCLPFVVGLVLLKMFLVAAVVMYVAQSCTAQVCSP